VIAASLQILAISAPAKPGDNPIYEKSDKNN
jgi:hypothetical protein